MRVLGLTLTACVILALSACSKSNAEKIIGKWEVVDSESGGPVGAVLEFTKDGRMKLTTKDEKGWEQTMEAPYKVEGDKITVTIKGAGGKTKSDTATIQTLSNTQLVIKNSRRPVTPLEARKEFARTHPLKYKGQQVRKKDEAEPEVKLEDLTTKPDGGERTVYEEMKEDEIMSHIIWAGSSEYKRK